MDSGFGDDEAYNVYDKPWRDEHSVANNIYRPSKKVDSDLYGDDLDTLMKNKRWDLHCALWCLIVSYTEVYMFIAWCVMKLHLVGILFCLFFAWRGIVQVTPCILTEVSYIRNTDCSLHQSSLEMLAWQTSVMSNVEICSEQEAWT